MIDEYELSLSVRSTPCTECKLLFDAISLKRNEWPSSKEQSTTIFVNVEDRKPVQIVWNKRGVFLRIFRPDIDPTAEDAREIPSVIGNAQLVPEHSDSAESLSLLQSWYQTCRDTQVLCQSKTQSVLPTRVIDTGTSLVTTADVSLLETEGLRGDYMALSYCWGDTKIHRAFTTVRANIDQFKQRIAFKLLPLTLQHAISLARKLKLRYIWIDALCIIQDDKEDWKTQAATMCDVYTKAAITVVACRSDGSSGGIFGVQKYSSYSQIPYKKTYVNVSEDYNRDHGYNELLHERSDLDRIHTRAWTFQEAILSTRAVLFTSQEMRWECNTCRECQCGKVSKAFPAVLDPDETEYELYRSWRLDDFFPATTIDEAYDQWRSMYAFYTLRILTNDSDRLVALSGLARRFANIVEAKFPPKGETYLAGIWRNSLPRGLLWHVESKKLSNVPNRRHERPRVWRAPSYSWASMEADVDQHNFGDLQSRGRVLETSTELDGPDPFGLVKEGPSNYLRLDSPLLRDIRFNHDISAKSKLQRFPTVSYQGSNLRLDSLRIDNDLEDKTYKHLQNESQDFAILIVGYSPGGDTHESLVLEPVAGRQETFQRIGIAKLGQHMREPPEHKRLIEAAPHFKITLI